MTDLLPCARCGRRPLFLSWPDGVGVWCGGYYPCPNIARHTRDEAIAAWNAQQARLKEELANG